MACFDGSGKPKGSFVALSTAKSTYVLCEWDVVYIASTSMTCSSGGSAQRAGIIATCLSIGLFLLRQNRRNVRTAECPALEQAGDNDHEPASTWLLPLRVRATRVVS